MGFGDCIDVAPQIFEFDEEGIATFTGDVIEAERERISEACASCPVDALVLFDEAKTQLVP